MQTYGLVDRFIEPNAQGLNLRLRRQAHGQFVQQLGQALGESQGPRPLLAERGTVSIRVIESERRSPFLHLHRGSRNEFTHASRPNSLLGFVHVSCVTW